MNYIKLKNWDKATSFLHFGLAVTVTLQLLFARLMHFHVPHAFLYHQIDGFLIFFIVLIHFIWSYTHKGFMHLFPWNTQGLKAISQDLRGLLTMHLPKGGPRPGLPGLIHGLGLLAVAGMAISGLIIFIILQTNLNPHPIKHIHSFIATFVWIYWFGHIAMALLHRITDQENKSCCS